MRRVHIKRAQILLLAAAILGLAWMGVHAYLIHRENLLEIGSELPDWPRDAGSARALVIAPHCDDETLGCAGIIREMKRHRVQVKVVIATNGDGFWSAAAKDFGELRPSPGKYVEFGYQRQRESLNALAALGVPASDVIFLGYPDRGISKMWLNYWDGKRPYTSPYTKDSFSPYDNAFRARAPYCGRALLWDLKKIIGSYRPTTVYYPHVSDQHPDHWAVNCFTVQALYELGALSSTRSGLYIVHRGDWPVPQGEHENLPLAPPGCMRGVGTRWYEYRMHTPDVQQKMKAVMAYRTQLPLLRRFLISFVRTSEVFGLYAQGDACGTVRGGAGTGTPDWADTPVSIVDPSGDGLNVAVGRNGDISGVQCSRSSDRLYVRVTFASRCLKKLTYGVRVHGLPDPLAQSTSVVVARGRKTRGPGEARLSGNTMVASIPLSALGKATAVMVSADAYAGTVQIDRSAWRLLTLSPTDGRL